MSDQTLGRRARREETTEKPVLALSDPVASVDPSDPAGIDWKDMATADLSGRVVLLTPDLETPIQAVWRKTREYREGRWQDTGFWALRNAGGAPVPFAPVAWSEFHE